jgi:hypothetical protein
VSVEAGAMIILGWVTLDKPMETWAQFVAQLGLSVTLVLFFVYTGTEREKKLSERLTGLEDLMFGAMQRTLEASTQAIGRNTDALNRVERAIEIGMCTISDHEIQIKSGQKTA